MKQPKCPPKNKLTFKLCNIQAVEYYIAGKVIQGFMTPNLCSINVSPVSCLTPISAVDTRLGGQRWHCVRSLVPHSEHINYK